MAGQRVLIDRTGQKIGKLTVIRRLENITERSVSGKLAIRAQWFCECECGGRIVVSSHSLTKALTRNGGTRSCGCLMGKKIKHGKVGSRIYSIWNSMRQRCTNPKNPNYASYGGRGIKVCKEWLDSFPAFFADMGSAPKGQTLDRRDNSLGYCKENCRWATKTEQGNNRRNNRVIEFSGKTQSLADWARETGLSVYCLRSRINSGWTIERALTQPNSTTRPKTSQLN